MTYSKPRKQGPVSFLYSGDMKVVTQTLASLELIYLNNFSLSLFMLLTEFLIPDS
jgi:hypothetical protein